MVAFIQYIIDKGDTLLKYWRNITRFYNQFYLLTYLLTGGGLVAGGGGMSKDTPAFNQAYVIITMFLL